MPEMAPLRPRHLFGTHFPTLPAVWRHQHPHLPPPTRQSKVPCSTSLDSSSARSVPSLATVRCGAQLAQALTARARTRFAVDGPCAAENAECLCKGQVRFGAGNNWTAFRVVEGSIECTTEVFGTDPAPGVAKGCDCRKCASRCLRRI